MTTTLDDSATVVLDNVAVGSGQTVRSQVFTDAKGRTSFSVELHVTGAPANVVIRPLGQDSAPASDSARLLALSLDVPNLSAMVADYHGVFLLSMYTAYVQIEVQSVSGAVNVTCYLRATTAAFDDVSSTAAVGISSMPALPAGTNAIGTVGVTSLPALVAGNAVIGHVIVDSQVAALPAGVNVIGHVIADASAAVIGHVIVDSQVAALPSGGNVIGHVIADASSAVIGHVINDASAAVIGHVIADASSAVIGHVIVDSQVAALPAGNNVIGHVIVDSQGSAVQLAASTAVIGHVIVDSQVAALPAGTNAIGKLAANSGVIIGDVNVVALSALPTGANAIGKLAANSGVVIGDVNVVTLPALPTVPYFGVATVATPGTRVALAATQALKEGVDICAHAGNIGIIYVGGVTVTSANGRRLTNGQSVFVRIADLATMYIDATVAGEGASYLGS